jgi:hypothetical protein
MIHTCAFTIGLGGLLRLATSQSEPTVGAHVARRPTDSPKSRDVCGLLVVVALGQPNWPGW